MKITDIFTKETLFFQNRFMISHLCQKLLTNLVKKLYNFFQKIYNKKLPIVET